MQIKRVLHLPDYLSPFLGVLKVTGAITIALPALRRFHEVTYAGFIFCLIKPCAGKQGLVSPS